MFQTPTNQGAKSTFTVSTRSPYDAYYHVTDPKGLSLQENKIRIFHSKKNVPCEGTGMQDISTWEALNGRPVPPSYPFGSYAMPNVYTIEEWRNRGYAMVTGAATLLSGMVYASNYYGAPGVLPRKRRHLVASRKAYGTFTAWFLGGLVWTTYVAHCKEQSPAKLYYYISNRERLQASVLMGTAIGAVQMKNAAPWHGQFPRGSIMWHWVKFFIVAYTIFYGFLLQPTWYLSISKQMHRNFNPAVHNVAPWWLDTPSKPHIFKDTQQHAHVLTYEQTKHIPRETIELVDEYSPEFEMKKRYKYDL